MREEVEKSILDPQYTVLIIHGPKNSGKTFAVKNAIEKYGMSYIYLDENDYSTDGFLKKFNIKIEFLKYMNILRPFSPESVNAGDIFISFMNQKIESYMNGIVVFDHFEKINQEFLHILPSMVEKLKENRRGKIVLIYNDDALDEKVEYVLRLIQGPGVKEITFNYPDSTQLNNILVEMGYYIPKNVVNALHSKTNGSLERVMNILRYLEGEGYIVDGLFIPQTFENVLKEIDGFVLPEKQVFQKLDQNDKKILLYLSLLDDSIDAFDLASVISMDEMEFINRVDRLIREKYIEEKDNYIRIPSENIRKEIINIFSTIYINSARIRLAQYLLKKGEKGRAGLLYFQAGKSEEAYPLLISDGLKYYEIQDYWKALEFLLPASEIMYDREVSQKLISILGFRKDYKKIVELCEKFIRNDPDNVWLSIKYAEALYNTGELLRAESLLRESMKKASNDLLLYSEILLSRVLQAREEYAEAKELLENALQRARKNRDEFSESLCLRLLGNIEYYNDRLERALDYYRQALALIENSNYYEDIASLYNNIANVILESDLVESMRYYSKALEISEKYWFSSLLQTLYNNMSILEIYQGNVRKGFAMVKKALNTSLSSGNYHLSLLSIMNMVNALFENGEIPEIERHLDLAIQISQKIDDALMLSFFRGYKKILNILKGGKEDLEDEIKTLEGGTPVFRDYAAFLKSSSELWTGNLKASNEIKIDSIKKRIAEGRTSPDLLVDIVDLLEFLAIENAADGKELMHIDQLTKIIEENRNYRYMSYIQWRLEIIKCAIYFGSESESIFIHHLAKLENEGLRYLVAKLRIVFGLYYARNKGDRSILDQGLRSMGEFNLPGLLKGYSLAYSFSL